MGMWQEGEALGVDWADVWKRVKDEVKRRRGKVPAPGDPGSPIAPPLPDLGPPRWLLLLVAFYLMMRWE